MILLFTLLGISSLVVLHELGHMLVARACGMRVLRFSVGFGPTLFSRQIGDTIWQVAAIPMGGFVQIDGMGPSEEDSDDAPAPAPAASDAHSYRSKPVWQRFLVIFAGPAANWLVCAALLVGLGMTTGFSRYDETQPVLGELEASGPGAQAGLREGDRVVRVGTATVSDWASLVTAIRAHPQEAVPFELLRNGQPVTVVVTPKESKAGHFGAIEAAPMRHFEHYGPGGAVVAGIKGAWGLTVDQARMLAGIFTGSSPGQLSGLPGIVKAVSKQAERGISRLFENLAWISIGLCLLNLAPVPALDGSRLLFLLIELVRRRPVDERIEGLIHTAGFVLLLGMMVFVSVRDLL